MLHNGIVQTAPLPAHALSDLFGPRYFPILSVLVVPSPVRVENGICFVGYRFKCIAQRVRHHLQHWPIRDCVTDNLPVVQIHQKGQVEFLRQGYYGRDSYLGILRLFCVLHLLCCSKDTDEVAVENRSNDQGYPVRDNLRLGQPIQIGHSVHEKEHSDQDNAQCGNRNIAIAEG